MEPFLSLANYDYDPYSERAEDGLHFDYSCQGHLTNFHSVSQPGEVPKSGFLVQNSGY